MRLGVQAALDDAVEARERAAADEEDVLGVHRNHLLLGVLAAALRRHVDVGAFEQLQQRLLHALAAHVARDAGVVALAGNLVDFVDVHDAALGGFEVVVGRLQQAGEDAFHVFAHVAGLGQHGGIGNAEGHLQDFGQHAGQEGFAGAGFAHHDDVRLLNLHLVLLGLLHQALVVVVHGHGHHALGFVLAHHVLVEVLLDGLGLDEVELGLLAGVLGFGFFVENVLGLAHALLADVGVDARNHNGDFALALIAKGTGYFGHGKRNRVGWEG